MVQWLSEDGVLNDSEPELMISECRLCPRRCGVNRSKGALGYCATGAELAVAAVCPHSGEEPVLGRGGRVCNVFFLGCNLRCVFCQNYQISRGREDGEVSRLTSPEVVTEILRLLRSGIDTLGLVSPSHQLLQTEWLLDEVFKQGLTPTVIFNTNAYDSGETLARMRGKVDIYLPDFKYADARCAGSLSDAGDYPGVALKALQEMIRQVGAGLEIDESGVARRGLIIRHLVLPGMVANSIAVLRLLARHFGTGIHISLMSQYRPPPELSCPPPLDRGLRNSEYRQVADEALNLGFENGWFQDPGSPESNVPDFAEKNPFAPDPRR